MIVLPATVNIVPNGDFEPVLPSPWLLEGQAAINALHPIHAGTHALYLYADYVSLGPSEKYSRCTGYLSATVGKVYTPTFWVRGFDTGIHVSLIVSVDTGLGAWDRVCTFSPGLITDWQQVSALSAAFGEEFETFTALSTSCRMKFECLHDWGPTASTGSYNIDDVEVLVDNPSAQGTQTYPPNNSKDLRLTSWYIDDIMGDIVQKSSLTRDRKDRLRRGADLDGADREDFFERWRVPAEIDHPDP